MTESETHPLHTLPAAQAGRLIDFDTARVVTQMIEPPRPVLVVTGEKPYPHLRVDLVPLVYVRRPEFWGIEVVGSFSGRDANQPLRAPARTQVPTPYAVELNLTGLVGTQGIEVVGANHTERIALPVDDAAQFVGLVEDGTFRRLFPQWVQDRFLRLTTVAITDDAGPEVGEIDLSPYHGELLRVRGNHRDGWVYSAVVLEAVAESILSIVARQVFADPAEGVHVLPVEAEHRPMRTVDSERTS